MSVAPRIKEQLRVRAEPPSLTRSPVYGPTNPTHVVSVPVSHTLSLPALPKSYRQRRTSCLARCHAMTPKLLKLTLDEARRIASNIAKPPATGQRLALRQRAITLTFTVATPPMSSAKGGPWAFTDSRFLHLPPHHYFSVPVLKQVQSHSIAQGNGGGHNPRSLESQYRAWRSL